jgi:hypothetical protein
VIAFLLISMTTPVIPAFSLTEAGKQENLTILNVTGRTSLQWMMRLLKKLITFGERCHLANCSHLPRQTTNRL